MRQPLWVLALAVLLARVSAATAQDPTGLRIPAVDAGEVATVILRVPAPEGVDSAAYTLRLDAGFQAFIPAEGRVGRIDDLFLVPVSFATPDRLPAGQVSVGQITIRVDGHGVTERELAVRVRERRDVVFALDAEEMTVAPDGVAGVPFRVHNRGNLADTLYLDVRAEEGWSLVNAPRLVLEPGDSATGVVRIAAPSTASPGDRKLVLVAARSVAGEQVRTLGMVVVSPSGWLGDLAHVPSSVFIGQALGTGLSPVVALTGAGRIGPDTEVRLDLRHTGGGVVDPALQRELAGAGLRVAVTRPDLEVAAGDVYGFESTLSGSLRQARGLRSEYDDPNGPLSFRALAALPEDYGSGTGGHVLHGEAGLETSFGQLAVLAGDILEPARGTLAAIRSSGGGVRWSGERGPHRGSVEATFVQLTAADSLREAGPALEVQYQLATDALNGRLRVRQVPGAATGPGGQGNELAGSFSATVAPRLTLVGWGYRTRQAFLGHGSTAAATAANLGLRGRVGRFQLQLGGNLSDRVTHTAVDSFDVARSTVRGEAIYTRGSFALQSDAEIGTSRELGRRGGYQALGASARWYGQSRWGWMRILHTRRPGGLESTTFHAGGTVSFGPAELSGGLSTTLAGDVGTTSFWSGTEIRAQRNLSVHIGASARPTLGAPDWTFSIGVRRRLNLPLPVARQPDLHGVVFDDANDNGVRDPGEPAVPGVRLNLGYLEATTDDQGRFAFRDANGARLQVRSGQLPLGYLLSPHTVLPTRGDASIPLLRTATVHLELFLDRDEDGARDRAESPADGAVVTLTDERGRRRTTTADSTGRVRVTGLLPGHYAVTAQPAGSRSGDDPEVLMEVELAPGAEVHHTLAVPLRRRTIRMGGEGGGNPRPETY